MRFLIVGAGGIGCYYGARLLQQGHDVVLVARGEHLQALQRGLEVQHEHFQFQGPVTALDEQTLRSTHAANDFDLILLCFKSSATTQWLVQSQVWLASAPTPVLSLQNGVDNEPAIAAALGRTRTLGGLALRIGGHIVAPGVVHASGPAQIIFGFWPERSETDNGADLEPFAEAFEAAGIPTTVTDQVAHELWRKLIINNGVNPLSALTGLDTHTLCRHRHFSPAVKAMMAETVSVAVADGIVLTPQDAADMFDLISSFNAIKTSMLVDKEKGRQLELDAISGAVIRRGQGLGVPTPVTALVHGLLAQAPLEK